MVEILTQCASYSNKPCLGKKDVHSFVFITIHPYSLCISILILPFYQHDPDIQHLPFFAVSTKFFDNLYSSYHNRIMHFRDSLPARVLVSMQHYLFYVVLFFGRFNLFAMSYIHLFRSAQSRDGKVLMVDCLNFSQLTPHTQL